MKQLSHNIPEYEVSQFNNIFKDMVEKNFDYVRIRGEISELKQAASGHIYLTLKDASSILNATIWNQKKQYLNIQPEIGMDIIVTGKISTYAKSISTYSINIDKINEDTMDLNVNNPNSTDIIDTRTPKEIISEIETNKESSRS